MVGFDGCYIGIKVYVFIFMLMIDYICEVFDQVLNDLSNGNIIYFFVQKFIICSFVYVLGMVFIWK